MSMMRAERIEAAARALVKEIVDGRGWVAPCGPGTAIEALEDALAAPAAAQPQAPDLARRIEALEAALRKCEWANDGKCPACGTPWGPAAWQRDHAADCGLVAALAGAAQPQAEGARDADDLRAQGWAVAVHNDYRQDGAARTFWLLTHASGRWVKGEGRTDAEALDQIRAALAAAPRPSEAPEEPSHG